MQDNKTFISIINKVKTIAEERSRILFELTIVMGIVGLFTTLAILTAKSRGVFSGPGIILLTVFMDLGTISCFLLITVKHFKEICSRYLNYIKRNPLIFILCAVFIVLAAFQFNLLPRGDANLYYGRLMFNTEKYQNTLESFVKGFIIWGHVIQGLSLFLGIGEMLFPRLVVGVYGVSLILTIISFLCLYSILGKFFPKTSKITKSIATAIMMSYPYILGLFTYINPDYYVCVFTVIMVYCYLKKFNILFVFFAMVNALTKEPGIIIYCAFIGAALLTEFIMCKEENLLKRSQKTFLSIKNITLIIPPVLFLVLYQITGKVVDDNPGLEARASFHWDNEGIDCFGFNISYILDRLIQFFVSNSTYLTTIVCICGFFAYIYKLLLKRSIKLLSSVNAPAFMGLIAVLGSYVIFICLFLTRLCPRYVTVGGFWLAVFAFASVHVLFRRKIVRNIVLGLLVVIFFIQTYYNIDPYMRLRAYYIHTGKRFLYGAVYKEVDAKWAGDSRNFNNEFTFYDSLLQSVLRRIDPDEDTIIAQMMVPQDETMICGLETAVYWNTRTKKRTFDYKDPDIIFLKVPVLYTPDEVQQYAYPDVFYLLTVPYFDGFKTQFLMEFEKRNYYITDTYKAENFVGRMTVYQMTLSEDS
jgi:hypothetical protein